MGEAGGSGGPLKGGKFTTWEGGVRVPAVFHWPGKIPAGITIDALASLLDVYPTFVAIAKGSADGAHVAGGIQGAALRFRQFIDGVDLTQLLLNGDGDGAPKFDRGGCLFFYGGTPGAGCGGPHRQRACPGLWAVRCGPYKRHFVTRDGQRVNPNVLSHEAFDQTFNRSGHGGRLIYQVEHDPGESYPLSHHV